MFSIRILISQLYSPPSFSVNLSDNPSISLLSLFTVIYKQKEADSLKDNDLKYRYINMMGEDTSSLLTNLDSIFEYRHDSVKVIRKEVVSFEKAVIERAKRLEKARIKEMEAEKLREGICN